MLGGILFFAWLCHPAQTFGITVPVGQTITLGWDQSSDTGAAGYNIYYGVASHAYTNVINVGNVTSATVSGLVPGVTYYFAATVYDNLGDESPLSDEVVYTVPEQLPTVQISSSATAGQFTLTVSGLTGHTYQILATQDFTTWIVIGTVTVGTGGSLDFTDPNAAAFPQRFYRIQG